MKLILQLCVVGTVNVIQLKYCCVAQKSDAQTLNRFINKRVWDIQSAANQNHRGEQDSAIFIMVIVRSLLCRIQQTKGLLWMKQSLPKIDLNCLTSGTKQTISWD